MKTYIILFKFLTNVSTTIHDELLMQRVMLDQIFLITGTQIFDHFRVKFLINALLNRSFQHRTVLQNRVNL